MNMRFLVTTAVAAVMFTSVAQAADLGHKLYTKAPVPVAAPFSWTGFYVGGHIGGGWRKNSWSDFNDPINGGPIAGADANYRTDGFLAGGQVGYNWQSGWAVIGIEADASWSNISGGGNNSPLTGGTGCLQQNGGCTSEIEALGTITGRFGAAIDRTLVYVKGGGAWMQEKHTLMGFDAFDPTINWKGTTSETRWGWTVGVGAEYAFAANWSVKAEYNYFDFSNDRVNFTFVPAPGFGASGTVDRDALHVVKAGVNYHF